MPDQRKHRGAHPEDEGLFAPAAVPRLGSAVADLSWLLTRQYATPGSLKLVGDRYELTQRQRTAVMRCACADEALRDRRRREAGAGELAGRRLLVDGYNVLTTVEAALARGVILVSRDGCLRDMASIHGTYRKVEETRPALGLIGELAGRLQVAGCVWYLDSPVSNSGRLRALMLDLAKEQRWEWQVELVFNPDAVLGEASEIVATADSVVLDRCKRWFNLAREAVESGVPGAWVVDVGGR